MVLGYIWYGPFFGKAWARIIGMDMSTMTPEQKKEMGKKMGPMYLLNFLLAILIAGTLGFIINNWAMASGLVTGLIIWLGFVMPMMAMNAMWSGKAKKLAWQMFWLTAGYQLICFIIAGVILAAWQ